MKYLCITAIMLLSASRIGYAQETNSNQFVDGKLKSNQVTEQIQIESFTGSSEQQFDKLIDGREVTATLNSNENKNRIEIQPMELNVIDGKVATAAEMDNFKQQFVVNGTHSKKEQAQLIPKVNVRNPNATPIPFPKEEYQRKPTTLDHPVNTEFPKDNYQRKTTE